MPTKSKKPAMPPRLYVSVQLLSDVQPYWHTEATNRYGDSTCYVQQRELITAKTKLTEARKVIESIGRINGRCVCCDRIHIHTAACRIGKILKVK